MGFELTWIHWILSHSIQYNKLISYFYIFSVFNIKTKMWLSIDDTKRIANILHLPTAPLLFRGTFESLNAMKQWMERKIRKPSMLGSQDTEGFVVRTASAIRSDQFGKCIAKFVRKGHIQTDDNWTKTWKKVKLIEMEQILEYHPQPMDNGNYSKSKEHRQSRQSPQNQQQERKQSAKQSKKQRKSKKVKVGVSLKTSLIICVGLPGSGKSTFCKHLCDERSEWSRCGTDMIKAEDAKHGVKRKRNKNAVFDFVARRIKGGHKVIVKCLVYIFSSEMA